MLSQISTKNRTHARPKGERSTIFMFRRDSYILMAQNPTPVWELNASRILGNLEKRC